MITITPQIIRDKLSFEGPMSYADLLVMAPDSKAVVALTEALEKGLDTGMFKYKYVSGQGYDAAVYYTTLVLQ
jgi:hypothetical protein